MLSHPNATLAPQARASVENLNYMTRQVGAGSKAKGRCVVKF